MPVPMTLWDANDDYSDSIQLGMRVIPGPVGAVVSLWAGDEDQPAYWTPAAARKAAKELPAILERLADEAERAAGARL